MKFEDLASKLASIFLRWGINATVAESVAKNMANAHRYGHATHGVQLLPRYHRWLHNFKILNKDPVLEVDSSETPLIKINAHRSFGHWALPAIINKCANIPSPIKSFQIQRLGHTGYVAECLRQSNIDDHIVLLWINTSGSKLVRPYNGTGKMMSTSVFAAMTPGGYVVDMSTTSTAENTVHYNVMSKKELTNGCLALGNGNLTTNPKDLYVETPNGLNAMQSDTAILFKDHKMFNLGILAEILAGLYTGSGTSRNESFYSGCSGIMLKTNSEFGTRVQSYLDWIKNSPEVRLPGTAITDEIVLQPWEQDILDKFLLES